jgi:hypothetical protein
LVNQNGRGEKNLDGQKLEIARRAELSSIASVARAEGIHSTMVGRCAVVGVNSGYIKAVYNDKTPTITKALTAFCETAAISSPPLPITMESTSIKAKELAARLLHDYGQDNYICTIKEVDTLKDMELSSNWSHRWLFRNNFISNDYIGKLQMGTELMLPMELLACKIL